jgi:hypothetical protein
MISAMTTDQATIIIRESIREAAKTCGCKPSDAHRPTQGNKTGLKARNLAIRTARAQGIPVHFLANAFSLSRETIQNALRDEVAV